MMKRSIAVLTIAQLAVAGWATAEEDIFDQVSHHYADNDGVKLHYVTIGEGSPVLFVHGFPDFWYA